MLAELFIKPTTFAICINVFCVLDDKLISLLYVRGFVYFGYAPTRNPQTKKKGTYIFFFMVQQPLVGQVLLTVKASGSHSDISYAVGLLWTSDRPVAKISS
jgi:hypothetical protein